MELFNPPSGIEIYIAKDLNATKIFAVHWLGDRGRVQKMEFSSFRRVTSIVHLS